jgi:hypothetical protein
VHLSGCPACRAELSSLAEVAVSLSAVDRRDREAVDTGGPATVTRLMQRRAARARVGRRRRTALAAAAAILLAGGGVAVGMATSSSGSGQTAFVNLDADHVLKAGRSYSATDPSTRVQATVAMQPDGWGTTVALRIGQVKGPLVCQLVAVSRTGDERVVTGWAVPVKGYGLPGSPPPLVVEGGTDLTASQVSRFEVRTSDGRTLVAIPI